MAATTLESPANEVLVENSVSKKTLLKLIARFLLPIINSFGSMPAGFSPVFSEL
jgi:hypothetical protein